MPVSSEFRRIWIYSHHIYNRTKRRDILQWARQLKVTGFCMPGKPGIICIEGYSSKVDEMWFRIRRMRWKKIGVKEKEDFQIGNSSIESFQKFDSFCELKFEFRGGKVEKFHVDLQQLSEFLEQHGCGNKFNLYFGEKRNEM